jgi:hypothetical protein
MKKMKEVKAVLWIVALILLTTFSFSSTQKADLSGTWVGKTEVPDSGTDEVTLVLQKSDDGYTGIVNDSLAVIGKDTAIRDIKLEGDRLSFAFNLPDGNWVMMKVTVTGDTMEGQWEHQEGGIGAIELVRKK